MLFSSYEFILIFLPATLLAFHALRRFGQAPAALGLLVIASWIFYAYWNPPYLALLIASVVFNYLIARPIAEGSARLSKASLAVGVAVNLAALLWYKYSVFILENVGALTGFHFALKAIILPLGISFFTFQQIAYLADCRRDRTYEASFRDYALFVSFFPQLIAGPIVHHSLTRPQFHSLAAQAIPPAYYMVGLALFAIGLAKKILIADPLGLIANPAFKAADAGAALDAASAWVGTLAYTFQIYFDFSGYSDMAIGLGLLFGVRLPINFLSPYKSTSIAEFWRRWHMTLGAFLRQYLYIPLGGNRSGQIATLRNLFVTMFLCGIWHGAGWGFVIWGAAHGACVAFNHAHRMRIEAGGRSAPESGPAIRALKVVCVLFIVALLWVLFRAETLSGAFGVWRAMFFLAPEGAAVAETAGAMPVLTIAFAAALALFAPNSIDLTRYTPDPEKPLAAPTLPAVAGVGASSSGSVLAASVTGIIFAVAFALMWRPQEFIYFDF